MFFKRAKANEITEGARYERLHNGNMIERVEVLWIGDDGFGIPHVRYRVSYSTPNREEFEGTKMLALESFSSLYTEVAGKRPPVADMAAMAH